MTSINFSARFIDPLLWGGATTADIIDLLLSGGITTAFRTIKKRQAPKVGTRIKLFAKQRTKHRRLLGTATAAFVEELWALRGVGSCRYLGYSWDVTRVPADLRYDLWAFKPYTLDDDIERAAVQAGYMSGSRQFAESTICLNGGTSLNGTNTAIFTNPNSVNLTHPTTAAPAVLLPLRRVGWRDFVRDQHDERKMPCQYEA